MSETGLALVAMECGQIRATFLDADKTTCIIQESEGVGDGFLRLGPKYGRKMLLTRDHAADLLPLMVAFVETGRLREIPILTEDDPRDGLDAFPSEYDEQALRILVEYLSKQWMPPGDVKHAYDEVVRSLRYDS